MKKLFVKKDACLFWVEIEGAVYSTFNHSANKHTFYDCNGNVLENYSRPPIRNEESVEPDDPDFFEKIGEGFIGLEGLKNVITNPRLKDLPFYLETPNELDGYEKEIALLRSVRGE